MNRRSWLSDIIKGMVMLAPLATLYSGSCAADLRHSMQAGALDYVKSSTEDVLTEVLPVKGMFASPG